MTKICLLTISSLLLISLVIGQNANDIFCKGSKVVFSNPSTAVANPSVQSSIALKSFDINGDKVNDLVFNHNYTYADAINTMKRKFIKGDFGELYQHPNYWAPYVYYGK